MSADRQQLDPLSWLATSANILPYPQARNVGRARQVVSSLLGKTTQASRQRHFDQALHRLGVSLEASGLTADQIDRELADFTKTVNHELRRSDIRLGPGAV